tara:strand:+ start:2045 stop:2341 length:297 start_codon:yes stop_codon:yes gene_type:complete
MEKSKKKIIEHCLRAVGKTLYISPVKVLKPNKDGLSSPTLKAKKVALALMKEKSIPYEEGVNILNYSKNGAATVLRSLKARPENEEILGEARMHYQQY